MEQDVRMLAELARTPFAVPATPGAKGAPAIGAADAVDRISAWLLGTSGISGNG
jgi:hypothetical protein